MGVFQPYPRQVWIVANIADPDIPRPKIAKIYGDRSITATLVSGVGTGLAGESAPWKRPPPSPIGVNLSRGRAAAAPSTLVEGAGPASLRSDCCVRARHKKKAAPPKSPCGTTDSRQLYFPYGCPPLQDSDRAILSRPSRDILNGHREKTRARAHLFHLLFETRR